MKERQKETARQLTDEVIRRWNPYGIFADDAPTDRTEFAGEVQAIVRQLGRVHSTVDMAHAIARVFASSFSAPERFTPATCATPARELFDLLAARSLVSRSES